MMYIDVWTLLITILEP